MRHVYCRLCSCTGCGSYFWKIFGFFSLPINIVMDCSLSNQLFLNICRGICWRNWVTSSKDAAAGEEQSSDKQRTLRRQYCKWVDLGGLPEVCERKIWNIWPPCSSNCNALDHIMLGVFLLHVHVILTTLNTGEFLNLKIMELVVSLNRNTMAKACLGFLASIEELVVANNNSIVQNCY